MALIIQKYGGTSVGSVCRIEAVADTIIKTRKQGHQVVVVVSAMSGETSRLIDLAHQIDSRPSARELDVLSTVGEQVAASLLAMAIIKRGYSAISLLADQIKITTDNHFGRARIEHIDSHRLEDELEQGHIAIIAGFQGRDIENNITSLGRGGTDTTAVAVAAALKADECQIYTDVEGVYTTDPRIVPEARLMEVVTFDEMLELASLGAKVLHIRCVEYAGLHKIPLRVLSSFKPGKGTLITYEGSPMTTQAVTKTLPQAVSGIAANKDEAIITIIGAPNSPMLAADILTPVGEAGIEVDMIVQNIKHDDSVDFTFTVNRSDFEQAKAIAATIVTNIDAKTVQSNQNVAKISVVGVGMKSHSGVASVMFQALGREGINLQLIATSEIKISVVVEERYLELSVRALHSAFNLDTPV
jgi:aspartate kinase